MSRPILALNGYDITEYVESIMPTGNGLNADGSGRDVETGTMFRTKIADKLKLEVKMLRLPSNVHRMIAGVLAQTFYSGTVLHPDTDSQTTRTFYTDTRPFGVQRYDKSGNETFYDGMTFQMIER